LPVSSWKAASGNRGKATREAAAPPNAWHLVSERLMVAEGKISRPDPDFEVVELPGGVLLVGTSNTGFETVTVIGYKSDLIAKLAGRLFATAGSPRWFMTKDALAQIVAAGFTRSAIWREAEQTQVFAEVPAEPGIYAFVVEGQVRYIGKTHTTLRGRMMNYQRRQRMQALSRPVHLAITEVHRGKGEIEVYTIVPDLSDHRLWNGLRVDFVVGLEAGMIQQFKPVWNQPPRDEPVVSC
jgi:hypothetical protein